MLLSSCFFWCNHHVTSYGRQNVQRLSHWEVKLESICYIWIIQSSWLSTRGFLTAVFQHWVKTKSCSCQPKWFFIYAFLAMSHNRWLQRTSTRTNTFSCSGYLELPWWHGLHSHNHVVMMHEMACWPLLGFFLLHELAGSSWSELSANFFNSFNERTRCMIVVIRWK